MKANRKFKDGEEAVSAVIGVILMVAITVAIAATVYVYVSGMMGTGQESAPTLQFSKTDTTAVEKLEVTTADPGNIVWGDIDVLIDGNDLAIYDITTQFADTATISAGQILDVMAIADAELGASYTTDFTLGFRHVPTNTLIGSYDFVR